MIVLNTLNHAVTEYSLAPQSMTPTHFGDALGLYAFGGDNDDTTPIIIRFVSGKTEWGSSLKKRVNMVYFAVAGEGVGELIVQTPDTEYNYTFNIQSSGQSRAQPGKGIHENYLAFGYSNPGGESFTIDRIEVLVAESATRRV